MKPMGVHDVPTNESVRTMDRLWVAKTLDREAYELTVLRRERDAYRWLAWMMMGACFVCLAVALWTGAPR